MESRADELMQGLPQACEGLWGSVYALATLQEKRAQEGFELAEDEAQTVACLWWASSCAKDPGLASAALTLAEYEAEDNLLEDPANPFYWHVRETVSILADAACKKGFVHGTVRDQE